MIRHKTVTICDICGYQEENYHFNIPMDQEPTFFEININFRDGYVGYSGHLCCNCLKSNKDLYRLCSQLDTYCSDK